MPRPELKLDERQLSEQLRLPLESAVVASQDEDADLGRLTVAAGLAVENAVV